MGITRTIDEIAEASNLKKRTIARTYRKIVVHLQLNVAQLNHFQCIEKIGSKMELNEKKIRQAADLMKKIIDLRFSAGRDPVGLAGAVLYLSSQMNGAQKITISEIAKAAGVTCLTLRSVTKYLK